VKHALHERPFHFLSLLMVGSWLITKKQRINYSFFPWHQASGWIEKPKEKEYDDDQIFFLEENHGKRDHQDGLRGLHVRVRCLGS
jgi:hypothetical protein